MWGTLAGKTKRERGLKNSYHRQAVNVVIQGSGADLVKISQRNIWRRVQEEKLPAHQISQVHDEIIMETEADYGDRVLKLVIEEMENCVKLRVPLVSEGAVGDSWGKAKAA